MCRETVLGIFRNISMRIGLLFQSKTRVCEIYYLIVFVKQLCHSTLYCCDNLLKSSSLFELRPSCDFNNCG